MAPRFSRGNIASIASKLGVTSSQHPRFKQSVITLNLGCGRDRFGTVRLDIRKEGTSANLIADINYLPFKEGCFDIIRAWDVIEHLEKHPVETVATLMKLLRENGLIHIRTPSENYKQLIIEVMSLPFFIISCLMRKETSLLFNAIPHLVNFRKRMKGAKETSGFGGHRWLIKWGREIRWMKLIAWKYEIILNRGDGLKRIDQSFGIRG